MQFAEKLTKGLSNPDQKFILDMVYGLIKNRSPILTEIARSLEEDTRLLYTVKRLSNRAAAFFHFPRLEQKYLNIIQPQLRDDMYVIVDNWDITKPFGQQFEHLPRVHDGSPGRTKKGYMSANMSIASTKTKHPFPAYSHLFSAAEEYFDSTNVEIYKGLNKVQELFGDKTYTLVYGSRL